MSDDPSQNPLDFLQDLTFAPGWAKEPPWDSFCWEQR